MTSPVDILLSVGVGQRVWVIVPNALDEFVDLGSVGFALELLLIEIQEH